MMGVVDGGMIAAGPRRIEKSFAEATSKTPLTPAAGIAHRTAASHVARTIDRPSRSARALRLSRHQGIAGGAVELIGGAKHLERRIEDDDWRAEAEHPWHDEIWEIVDEDFAQHIDGTTGELFAIAAEEDAKGNETTDIANEYVAAPKVCRGCRHGGGPAQIDKQEKSGKRQSEEQRQERRGVESAAQRFKLLEENILVDGNAEVAERNPRQVQRVEGEEKA